MGKSVFLLVEDNPGDVTLFRAALDASNIQVETCVARDGGEAMAFLLRQQPYEDAPRPAVVVLDLNLPLKNGQEVLLEMSDDPNLRTIPVAIFTTSWSDANLCDSYPGRCLYFTKTDEFGLLQQIVRQIVRHAEVSQS